MNGLDVITWQLCLALAGVVLLFARGAALSATLTDLWRLRALSEKAWRWRDFLLALGGCAAIACVFSLFQRGPDATMLEDNFMAHFCAQAMQVLALSVILAYNRTARAALAFAADWPHMARSVIAAYAMFFPVLAALVLASVHWVPFAAAYLGFEVKTAQPQLERFLSMPSSSAERIAFVLTAVIAAPLLEEILLRGYLFGILRQHLGWAAAAALNGAFFAFLHQDAVRFLPLMALGVFFCGLRERTRTLAAPIFCHGLHNGITLLFAWAAFQG